MAESGDSEIVHEVLSVFQTDTVSRLGSLKAGLAANDTAQVKTQAHSIKGSASQVGALGMATLCQRIESEAAAGGVDLPRLVHELETGFAEVSRAITAGKASLG
jgi:HPt (histidine-containing phosphotransfer) domain-containing protein